MRFRAWLGSLWPDPGEVRAEIWWLGVHYHGEALKGARAELKVAGLSLKRAALLRACVSRLEARPAPLR